MVYRFFGKRYSEIILSIREKKNMREYCKEIDMTPAHLTNVIDHWSRLGFLEKIKKGREVELKFTELGKEWKELIIKMDDLDKLLKNKRQNEGKS